MKNEFWITIPVKNLKKSTEFYKKSSFEIMETPSGTVLIGGKKKVQIMLQEEVNFKIISGTNDISYGNEVILSIQVESVGEIDQLASAVTIAGGEITTAPKWNGPMYSFGFKDIDGHKWTSLFYDRTK